MSAHLPSETVQVPGLGPMTLTVLSGDHLRLETPAGMKTRIHRVEYRIGATMRRGRHGWYTGQHDGLYIARTGFISGEGSPAAYSAAREALLRFARDWAAVNPDALRAARYQLLLETHSAALREVERAEAAYAEARATLDILESEIAALDPNPATRTVMTES